MTVWGRSLRAGRPAAPAARTEGEGEGMSPARSVDDFHEFIAAAYRDVLTALESALSRSST